MTIAISVPHSISTPGPDFIGIGARRCASTRMHQVLNAHPSVIKPEKGTHFFSENGGGEVGQYLQTFPVTERNSIRVDLSVSYLYPEYAEAAATSISKHRPEARLFATLRDPVARSYSDYMRSIMLKEIDGSIDFISACEANPAFIERSRYLPLFTPYWDRFGSESVELFLYEDLRRDKQAFYRQVAAYFSIDAAPFFETIGGETGHAHALRSQALQTVVLGGKTAMRRGARAVGMERAWTGATRVLQPAYQKILRLNGREVKITKREIAYAMSRLGQDTAEFMKAARLPQMVGWRH